MKQKLTINVPKNYSAVTLKAYLEFRESIEAYKDEPEAVEALAFNLLCGIPIEHIYKIDSVTFGKIREDLAKFLSNTEYELQRIIRVDGIEYGFEPNLSQMSYGAYLDCIKWDTITIDKNWSKIMSILYRPLKNKTGLLYEVQAYNGVIDDTKFLNTTMDVHFGALFFFIDLLKTLSNSILKSMKDQMEIFPQLNTILERNGNLTPLFTNWQKEILQNSIRL